MLGADTKGTADLCVAAGGDNSHMGVSYWTPTYGEIVMHANVASPCGNDDNLTIGWLTCSHGIIYPKGLQVYMLRV